MMRISDEALNDFFEAQREARYTAVLSSEVAKNYGLVPMPSRRQAARRACGAFIELHAIRKWRPNAPVADLLATAREARQFIDAVRQTAEAIERQFGKDHPFVTGNSLYAARNVVPAAIPYQWRYSDSVVEQKPLFLAAPEQAHADARTSISLTQIVDERPEPQQPAIPAAEPPKTRRATPADFGLLKPKPQPKRKQ
jgi:hypothetical protein